MRSLAAAKLPAWLVAGGPGASVLLPAAWRGFGSSSSSPDGVRTLLYSNFLCAFLSTAITFLFSHVVAKTNAEVRLFSAVGVLSINCVSLEMRYKIIS